MRLLALDTASELCSAALWLEDRLLWRETLAPRAQAALILPMIDALLAEAGTRLADLDAIAFGRGPGAFTGVRLAAGIAQGLGFATGRPLIGISDLMATAAQALELTPDTQRVLVCQDARMEEVYWGCFERRGQPDGAQLIDLVGVETVAPPADVRLPATWQSEPGAPWVAAGSGFAAYPPLMARLSAGRTAVFPQMQPRAREVARLAAGMGLAQAVPADQALPVYLRDRVTAVGLQSPN
jgi:tRNA threonylcarbamoyladenosine biosynthesis protein TsaB